MKFLFKKQFFQIIINTFKITQYDIKKRDVMAIVLVVVDLMVIVLDSLHLPTLLPKMLDTLVHNYGSQHILYLCH